jgi:PPP family 3-phenylpropionic acid transporter
MTLASPLPASPEGARRARLGLTFRLALFYGALSAPIGIWLPFWPLFLKTRGFDAHGIALVLAFGALLRVVSSPLFASIADRTGARRHIILLLLCSAALIYALCGVVPGILALFILGPLVQGLHSSTLPLAEAITLRATHEAGLEYGRVRLWGSIAFILANIAGGAVVAEAGGPIVVWLLVGTTASALGAVMLMPPDPPPPETVPTAKTHFTEMLALMRNRRFLLFLLSASLAQSAHATYYGFATLSWRAQHFGGTLIGGLWAVGVVAEILLFWNAGAIVRRLTPERLLALAGFASVVRWLAMSLQPPLYFVFPLQALHALTFGAAHLGAMRYIMQNVAPGLSATAQSLYAGVSLGLIFSLASAASGPLYARFGAGAYVASAAIGLASILGAWALARSAPALKVSGGAAA